MFNQMCWTKFCSTIFDTVLVWLCSTMFSLLWYILALLYIPYQSRSNTTAQFNKYSELGRTWSKCVKQCCGSRTNCVVVVKQTEFLGWSLTHTCVHLTMFDHVQHSLTQFLLDQTSPEWSVVQPSPLCKTVDQSQWTTPGSARTFSHAL